MYKLIERDTWLIELQCDWPEWFIGKYNWKDFTVVQLSWEHDIILGGLEVVAALIGFRIRVRYTYDENTPVNVQLRQDMNEIDACQHDWQLEPDGVLGPAWRCKHCRCSEMIFKPRNPLT